MAHLITALEDYNSACQGCQPWVGKYMDMLCIGPEEGGVWEGASMCAVSPPLHLYGRHKEYLHLKHIMQCPSKSNWASDALRGKRRLGTNSSCAELPCRRCIGESDGKLSSLLLSQLPYQLALQQSYMLTGAIYFQISMRKSVYKQIKYSGVFTSGKITVVFIHLQKYETGLYEKNTAGYH